MKHFHNFSDFVNEKLDLTENFEKFSSNRLDGASTIVKNAEEKGGDALLTYHHFKVKLPYYKKAAKNEFNVEKSKVEFDDLLEKFYEGAKNLNDMDQVFFQEIVGKLEVLGELIIKNSDSSNYSILHNSAKPE